MKIANKILIIKRLIGNLENNLEITYPLTDSKRVILTSLEKSRVAVSECINLALILENNRGNLKPAKSKQKNLENFFSICSKNIGITNSELEKIKEILFLAKYSKKSPMEFKRNRDIILLSSELKHKKINLDMIKEYKNLIEILLEKIVLLEKISNLKPDKE